MRSVSSRTWEPNAGSSAAATAAPRPGSARVSGTSSQATAAASKPASQGIDQERRGKADALGEQAARQRAHAHREQEDALVDGHDAAAIGGRGDVGQHDLAADEGERGAGAGDEAAADEEGVRRRVGAAEIPDGADESAERQDRATAGGVGQPAGRDGQQEAGEAVDRDRRSDRRLSDAERAGVEREHRRHRAEAELVNRDEDAEPGEDPRRRGRWLTQRGSSPSR
jgi:hypothetical protein